jgi:pimeloyl-ACP methyl ester carboxylesterase
MHRVKTQYKESGTGRTYVWLHGFCLDHTIWEDVRSRVDDQIRVVTPDLPGFGNSEALQEVYTINALGKWLNNWLQEQGIDELVLLGHSLGGYIALEFARRHEEKLAGLGLIHSHCFGDTEENKLERQRVEKFVANHGSVPYLKESIPNLFHEPFRIQKADRVAEIVHHNRFIDPDVVIHYLQAMRLRSNEEETLQRLQVPALFVMGADDQIVPLPQNLQQGVYPDISTIKIMDETGHMGMIENPDQVADAILEFEQYLEKREKHIGDE